jgi:hypothetical protein
MAMNYEGNRVLGRILAVEETRDVSGGKQPPGLGTGPDGEIETSCIGDTGGTGGNCDTSAPVNDSATVADTGVILDSGTVSDTGAISDCPVSTTKFDINPDPNC